MGLRQRKATLVTVLQAHKVAGHLDAEQVETFRLMYARARSEKEQDEVTAAVRLVIDGWKTANDRLSKVLRRSIDDDDDEDEVVIPPHARPW